MVIDTNLFIEFFRSKDKSKTTLALLNPETRIYISAISVFELFIGANTPERLSITEAILSGVEILNFDGEIAKLTGKIYDQLQRSGLKQDFRDVMIAATAIHHNFPVKTLNQKHFANIPGLVLA
jgi:tRNA(fMet)-specific endonuclease VapC